MTQDYTPPPTMDGNSSRPFSSTNPFRLSALEEATTQPVVNRGDNQGFHHWMDNQLSSPNPVPAYSRTDRKGIYNGSASVPSTTTTGTSTAAVPVQVSSNNPFLDDTEMTESAISSDYSRESPRNISPMRPSTGRSAGTAASHPLASAPRQYVSTSSHSLPIQRRQGLSSSTPAGVVNNDNTNSISSSGPRRAPRYPTSREEKERLRQKYLNVSDSGNNGRSNGNSNNNGNNENGDLPPSYEEVAGARDRNRYPREKDPARVYDLDQQRRSNNHNNRHLQHHHHHHHNSSSTGTGAGTHGYRQTSSHSSRRYDEPGVVVPRYRRDSGSASATAAANMRRKKKLNGKLSAPKNVDTIDRLDVTGLFGGSFHHDGPFDACTPHRNKDTKAAPVLAFPADGPNNSISGATAKKSVMNEMFGVEDIDDDYDGVKGNGNGGGGSGSSSRRYSSSLKDSLRSNVGEIKQMDAKTKTEKVHEPVTAGLGSSTFLDGAPAPSYMIKASNNSSKVGGLHRGKSLNYTSGRVSSSKSGEVRRNTSLEGRRRKSESNYDGRGYVSTGFNNKHRGGGGGDDYDDDSDDDDASGSSNDGGRYGYNYEDDSSREEEDDDEEEDAYVSGVGMRFEGNMRREALTAESSGNKFLKRVKSLKVGGSKKR